MASKKRRKKASKKVGKKVTRHRKKASVIGTTATHTPKVELELLHKIDKKVGRIDRTVNAGLYLAHRAKKAKRKHELEKAWAEREESGLE